MKLHLPSVLASLGVVALGVFSNARAQDFNVDVSSATGTPPPAYGAGADQPGTWNGVHFVDDFGPHPDTVLVNTAGALTGVVASCVGGFGTNYAHDNAGTASGGDAELMDDYQDVGLPPLGGTTTWTFSGLASGSYAVYSYAWDPLLRTDVSNVSVAGTTSTNPQTCGGAWPGVQTLGITYTRHFVVVTAGTIQITVSLSQGVATVNGFQLDQLPIATTAFCFGDGTGTQCPCPAQNGAAGNGCRHSQSATGANLTSTGSNDVSTNNLTLTASLMPVGTFVIFQQGTETLGGGLGILSPSTDGLDCIGGTLVRIGRSMTFGGTASVTNIVGAGAIPPEGGTRHYQAIYRNANPAWCSPATLNGTNGLTCVWVP